MEKYSDEFEVYYKENFAYENNCLNENYPETFIEKKKLYYKVWNDSKAQSQKVIDEALELFKEIETNDMFYTATFYNYTPISLKNPVYWKLDILKSKVLKFIENYSKSKSVGLWKGLEIEKQSKEELIECIKFILDENNMKKLKPI